MSDLKRKFAENPNLRNISKETVLKQPDASKGLDLKRFTKRLGLNILQRIKRILRNSMNPFQLDLFVTC